MRIVRYFCSAYTALVALAIVVNLILGLATQYGNRVGTGCNFYDALLVGIECRGFVGAQLAALYLSWPLLLMYMLWFSFFSFWLILPTLLLWLPPLIIVTSYFKKRRNRT